MGLVLRAQGTLESRAGHTAGGAPLDESSPLPDYVNKALFQHGCAPLFARFL